MWNIDLNQMILPFFDPDWLSKLPLTESQIIEYADILNWDILSMRDLSLRILNNYPINWVIYYTTKKRKHIIVDKVLAYDYIFDSPRMKKKYYDNRFINIVPDIIDWNWCIKNIQLSEANLLRHWDKFNINLLCKHQHLTEYILIEKRDELNWSTVSKKEIPEKIIYLLRKYVDWSNICKYQTLSSEFIDNNYNNCDIDLITQYQELDEWFIRKHKMDINKNLLCRYQNMRYTFLKENPKLIRIDDLMQNINYNKKNSLQIGKINGITYIIEPHMSSDKIMFCNIDHKK